MALIGGSARLLFALLTGAAATASASTTPQQPAAAGDQAPTLRRLAATAALAAQEYAIGVKDGRVVAPAEVSEAGLFLAEARRSAELLPLAESRYAVAQIDTLRKMVAATASPDSVALRVAHLSATLSERLKISLDEVPASAPSLVRGREVYQANCAACHGAAGRGDGPAGRGLDPRPADLTDAAALRGTSPLDFYRRVTIGVAGTAMPAYETRLSADDRWAAAVYASLLRLPAKAHGDVPPDLRSFPATAQMSDSALLAALGDTAGSPAGLARLAAVRSVQGDETAAAAGAVFARVRRQIDSTYRLAQSGEAAAASAAAFDAYMTFEQVERAVRAKNPDLANALEAAFATLRTRAAGGATTAELDGIRADLARNLERAERLVSDRLSPFGLFLESFILLVREGLEAILIVGALTTFLLKTGQGHRRRDINVGIAAAIAASLLTAVLLETIFQVTAAKREALEGVTMLSATVVLFYVSYWLLSKMEVVKWTHFVKSKVQDAVTSGSALALASAAFLAVYREGFETVLFYKALFFTSGATAGPVIAGMVAGSVVLVAVYIAINRFGVRLPLKPFFAFTGAFLYYMAFVFAGRGVAEMQEGGWLPLHPLPFGWEPRVPALGIYPTVESIAAQGVLVLLALGALAWIFVVEPARARRLRVTSVMVPEPAQAAGAVPASAAANGSMPASAPAPAPALEADVTRELLRSLERMEADLAEMRAEVTRMKDHLTGDAAARRRSTPQESEGAH
ncbi:MAG TPA: FTR1 family protein [Gemmatimonadales bacterium]|nr:FTR1 family protein [Gemmatimonadales bacterium]